MAGHLARNQVHAGSIPAALTERGRRPKGRRCFRTAEIGVRFSAAPRSFRVGAPGRAVGLQSRRTAFESLLTRNADRMASVTSLGMTPRPTTSSACWKAPPNGRQRVPKTRVVALSPRGSIPPPSSTETTCMPVLHTRVLSERATAPGVRLSPSPPPRPSRQVGRRRAATSVSKRFDSALGLQLAFALEVFVAARRLARSEAGVQLPPGAQFTSAPLSEWLGPGLPNRRREFDSRTVLKPGGPRQLGGEPASRAAIVPQKR